MARSIVEGAYTIEIDGQEIELRKLTLGHLETLEKQHGSLDKALSSMKGIIHAIYLSAKRGGFEGKQSDIADNIEFDEMPHIIAAIANQATLTLSADESKIVGDLVAAALLAEDNEDAVASIVSIAKNHESALVGIKNRAEALVRVTGEAQGANR